MKRNKHKKAPTRPVVRWLGAFRHSGEYSFEDILRAELSGSIGRNVAAEPPQRGTHRDEVYRVWRSSVGLVVKRRAVLRKFSGDVWSEPTVGSYLQRTREEGDNTWSVHYEAFCRPEYSSVVVKGPMTEDHWRTLQTVSGEFELEIYFITRDLKFVKISQKTYKDLPREIRRLPKMK